MTKEPTSPFQIGDLVGFRPDSGTPAGFEGVVVGIEYWISEDTSMVLDTLSLPPESSLSAEESCTRVLVQIPLLWPQNRSLAKIKPYVRKLHSNVSFCLTSGPLSLQLNSGSTVTIKNLGGWQIYEASCDHNPEIKAIGPTPEMARLKLSHELIKLPHID